MKTDKMDCDRQNSIKSGSVGGGFYFTLFFFLSMTAFMYSKECNLYAISKHKTAFHITQVYTQTCIYCVMYLSTQFIHTGWMSFASLFPALLPAPYQSVKREIRSTQK